MNTATMNSFFPIDTLQFSKRMQKAGLDEKIADELAEVWREIQVQSADIIATKEETNSFKNGLEYKIDLFDKKLDSKIDLLDQKIDSQVNLLRKDIKIAMYTTIGSIAAIIIAVSVIKGFFI